MDIGKTAELIAQLMAVSAITAPKSKGENYVVLEIVTGKKLKKLAKEMIEHGIEVNDPFFVRDGESVMKSDAMFLVGLKDAKPLGLNCGGCGFERCIRPEDVKELRDFKGPVCMLRLLDLGIALGSAVKTASIHNVDTRIMYRAAVIARKMNYIDADVVMAIPMSISGKSIYFDRKVPDLLKLKEESK
ncbi:conserved hypothetical protein [Thermosulfidibacter takaii ABI70S6]|uniref:DUF2148 domain-containing protein n=1 Tax=Thermosulfidibacter takaii (strain DSM 17441 / JCM 13301 / NBRC 103674 / ABI70S6) TaxID=1298851 RepID=A0A0S3QTR9_THET7|nr:DUF2148 domain-containing protein [Thermosulfidibacter takaii]BAT71732.1 conserved hypothetical protein [Thermosulfidibacter takaii ABI70S6]